MSFKKIIARFWPLLIVLTIVLFPIEWLATQWPFLADLAETFFPTENRHSVGHFGIFFLLGLIFLQTFPNLRHLPRRYFGLILASAFGEELFQALFFHHAVLIIDSTHDMVFDFIGAGVAFGLIYWWNRRKENRAGYIGAPRLRGWGRR
jgi:hypothetical protein